MTKLIGRSHPQGENFIKYTTKHCLNDSRIKKNMQVAYYLGISVLGCLFVQKFSVLLLVKQRVYDVKFEKFPPKYNSITWIHVFESVFCTFIVFIALLIRSMLMFLIV